jgi:hypothetical protein
MLINPDLYRLIAIDPLASIGENINLSLIVPIGKNR